MASATDLPVFPDLAFSNIKRSEFHVVEQDDIADEADVKHLLSLLFDFPHRQFYYFHEKGRPVADAIARARDQGQILLNETDFFYYRHPTFASDYVRILPRNSSEYTFQWEREVVEKGPMFLRTTITLSPRMKRDMAAQYQYSVGKSLEKANPGSPFLLKPSFHGLGIDLPKVWPWLKHFCKKLLAQCANQQR